MIFAQKDARAIAEKLESHPVPKRRHDWAVIRIEGKVMGAFGIQRCSKEKSHDYIPQQMHLTTKECRAFRECSLSLPAYAELMRSRGQL